MMEGYSPRLLRKIVRQGSQATSFKQAAADIESLAEFEISAKHVERLTERVGAEWAASRDREVSLFQRNELSRPQAPSVDCAGVMLDGGRMLERAEGHPPGVFKHGWREPKYASCLSYSSKTFETDPQPDPPEKFVTPREVEKLTREIHAHKGTAPPANAGTTTGGADDRSKEEEKSKSRSSDAVAPNRLQRLVRTTVSTLEDSKGFGWMVALEVYKRNLDLASRKACVCDGQKYNWSIYEEYLKPLGFYAVLDFVHLLTYLYAAALAQADKKLQRGGWDTYERWVRWAWAGQVDNVIAELEEASQRIGPVPEDTKLPDSDPRKCVATTLRYVKNNRERMDYPKYRSLGLPVSSAPVESMIKQFNRRIKGSEKFWIESQAEAVLQVCGAYLSEDGRPQRLWNAPRPYRRAAISKEKVLQKAG